MHDRVLAVMLLAFVALAIYGVFSLLPNHYADPLPNFFATPMSRPGG